MSDRELLERAAGAAYYRYDADEDVLLVDKFAVRQHGWNPLEDDGDAFRLMVAAGLEVSPPCMRLKDDQAEATDYDCSYVCIENADTDHGGDPLAATRRAIVRAAAKQVQED